ncbi:hypothetical protein HOK021_14910 [Streptomyces hygroscopicus]|nr:hypothetical protein HOK021_14910 [Streptomyces hygroscopicus]
MRGAAICLSNHGQALREPQIVPLAQTQLASTAQEPDGFELKMQYRITGYPTQQTRRHPVVSCCGASQRTTGAGHR